MTPSDPNQPARPKRRFSALKPAVRSPRATLTASAAESHAPDGATSVAEQAPRPAPSPAKLAAAPKSPGLARVAKVMARAGLCSRRDAEAWIMAGRVAVNGAVLSSPARDVAPGDVVTVDGYPIDKPERTRLFLFNKTRGLVTTARDPEGRPTVFDALSKDLPRLMTVGRLDINTEGLLLLTNDGGLARLLELPTTGWIRRYRVRAHGATDQARLDQLAKGITIEGVAYAGIAAKLDRVQGANLWLTMGLTEGKNREIKRVLEHLGLSVTRLIRISFGPFQLGELADNAVEEVRTRVLRDQLGTTLAKRAGLDFDSPLAEERSPAPKAEPADEPPRRQTRRTQTADRRGRAVTVERVATVTPTRRADEARPPSKSSRPPRRASPGDAPARSRRPDERGKPRAEGRSRAAATAGPANRAERRRAASPATVPRGEAPGRGGRGERPDSPGRPPRSGGGRRRGPDDPAPHGGGPASRGGGPPRRGGGPGARRPRG